MSISKAWQSTPDEDPEPHYTPVLSLAAAALIFTIIVMQVHAVIQGDAGDPLPLLLAALLAVAGITSGRPPES